MFGKFNLTLLNMIAFCFITNEALAVPKLVNAYDKANDQVVNTPVKNPNYGSQNWSYELSNREESLSRALRFRQEDIVGKSLMDFGCNEGGILFACRTLGANKIIGIDYNEWCIHRAIEKAKQGMITNAHFFAGDMENKALLSTLPQVDTVFILAVLDSSSFSNKTATIASISRFAKKALYYEGHQTAVTHVAKMHEFLLATDFTRFEYLGRFEGRNFMRFSREKMDANQVPPGAVTSDHSDEELLNAEEIYWFSDSQRNPAFSSKCRLIQFVQR